LLYGKVELVLGANAIVEYSDTQMNSDYGSRQFPETAQVYKQDQRGPFTGFTFVALVGGGSDGKCDGCGSVTYPVPNDSDLVYRDVVGLGAGVAAKFYRKEAIVNVNGVVRAIIGAVKPKNQRLNLDAQGAQ
jgi:hypothetical protein